MTRTPHLITIALTLVAAASCSKRPVAESVGMVDGPGPQFRLIDSVVLEENDTVYLGKPEMGFVVDDSGLIYVADEYWKHVVRFQPNGKIDRVFGRAGDGPGEFRSTTRVAATMDSLVVLASAGRLKVFNRNTGRFCRHPTVQEEAGAISFLVQMWRLPNGETLLWHQQNRIEQSGEQYKFFGQDFLTLLSADRKRACVDTSIPFPGSEWPRLSVHGDTVLALDQISAGKDSTRAVSVIRRYQVADTHCMWMPVHPRHPRGAIP